MGKAAARLFAALAVACFVVLGTIASAHASGPFAYITNSDDSSVSVIDTSTNSVIATIPGLYYPGCVAVNYTGTRVYVANAWGDSVFVIDTASNTVITSIGVGRLPVGVAVNAAGTRVYVANSGSDNVSVIDTSTNSVVATIGVGALPYICCVDPAGSKVYVATGDYYYDVRGSVSVIDTSTNAVIATVGAGFAPYGIAINAAGTRAYATSDSDNMVSVIDTLTDTVIATIRVGRSPQGVAINPTGTRAYVTNDDDNSVSVIDTSTNTVVATVGVGWYPFGVAVNPAGTRLYVANWNSNNVSVIDTFTNIVIATIPVGNAPIAFGLFIGPMLSSAVTAPEKNAMIGGISYSITGTATDGLGPGVEKVEVSTDGGNTWHLATGTTSWNYNWTLPASNGGSCTIQSRATDNAGNIETPGKGVTVKVDNVPPTSKITNAGWQNQTRHIYMVIGTATDGAGSGLKKVEVSTDGGTTWNLAANTSTWYYTWQMPAHMPPGSILTVKSRATDKAGNVETPGKGVRILIPSY